MTRWRLVNVAQSVHQRLLARAQKEGRPFNELLQHYAIERFLYRFGQSKHAEKLLLKDALLLRVWQIPMARPTMDIDMLDKANSRMKDFHDIWTLARNLEFDGQRLSEAIRKTFERRKTELPKSVPMAFTSDFHEDKAKQTQWQAFLGKGLAMNEKVPFADVVKVIRRFLMSPTEALVAGNAFKMH